MWGEQRIERQVRAAGVQYPEQSDKHVERTFEVHADDGFRTDAQGLQMPRELIRPSIELREMVTAADL